MVYLVNRVTGGLMQVADDRAEKLIAAGHRPVASDGAAETTAKQKAAKKPAAKRASKPKKAG